MILKIPLVEQVSRPLHSDRLSLNPRYSPKVDLLPPFNNRLLCTLNLRNLFISNLPPFSSHNNSISNPRLFSPNRSTFNSLRPFNRNISNRPLLLNRSINRLPLLSSKFSISSSLFNNNLRQ